MDILKKDISSRRKTYEKIKESEKRPLGSDINSKMISVNKCKPHINKGSLSEIILKNVQVHYLKFLLILIRKIVYFHSEEATYYVCDINNFHEIVFY